MTADFYRLIFFFNSIVFRNSREWQEAQAEKLELFCFDIKSFLVINQRISSDFEVDTD
jgi:hypothetical protein